MGGTTWELSQHKDAELRWKKRESSQTLFEIPVQFCKSISALLCLCQLKLALCYLHQETVLAQKLESEMEFLKSNRS